MEFIRPKSLREFGCDTNLKRNIPMHGVQQRHGYCGNQVCFAGGHARCRRMERVDRQITDKTGHSGGWPLKIGAHMAGKV